LVSKVASRASASASDNGVRKFQPESFPKIHGVVLDRLCQVGDRNVRQEISNALFL
jgi:hypothetical protein